MLPLLSWSMTCLNIAFGSLTLGNLLRGKDFKVHCLLEERALSDSALSARDRRPHPCPPRHGFGQQNALTREAPGSSSPHCCSGNYSSIWCWVVFEISPRYILLIHQLHLWHCGKGAHSIPGSLHAPQREVIDKCASCSCPVTGKGEDSTSLSSNPTGWLCHSSLLFIFSGLFHLFVCWLFWCQEDDQKECQQAVNVVHVTQIFHLPGHCKTALLVHMNPESIGPTFRPDISLTSKSSYQ